MPASIIRGDAKLATTKDSFAGLLDLAKSKNLQGLNSMKSNMGRPLPENSSIGKHNGVVTTTGAKGLLSSVNNKSGESVNGQYGLDTTDRAFSPSPPVTMSTSTPTGYREAGHNGNPGSVCEIRAGSTATTLVQEEALQDGETAIAPAATTPDNSMLTKTPAQEKAMLNPESITDMTECNDGKGEIQIVYIDPAGIESSDFTRNVDNRHEEEQKDNLTSATNGQNKSCVFRRHPPPGLTDAPLHFDFSKTLEPNSPCLGNLGLGPVAEGSDDAIIRLSIPTYNSIINNVATLRKKLSSTEMQCCQKVENADSMDDQLQQLKARLHNMDTVIGSSDTLVAAEHDELKKKTGQMTPGLEQELRAEIAKKAALIQKFESQKLESQNNNSPGSKNTATPLERKQAHDLKQKSNAIDTLHAEITRLKIRIDHFQRELQKSQECSAHDHAHYQKTKAETEETIRLNNVEVCRLRNELRDVRQKLKATENLLQKSERHVGLEVGAILQQPLRGAKLGSNVNPCKSCFERGLTCDNKGLCQNCHESCETQCLRWRCAGMALYGQCFNQPCLLVHDAKGYLSTYQKPPTW